MVARALRDARRIQKEMNSVDVQREREASRAELEKQAEDADTPASNSNVADRLRPEELEMLVSVSCS